MIKLDESYLESALFYNICEASSCVYCQLNNKQGCMLYDSNGDIHKLCKLYQQCFGNKFVTINKDKRGVAYEF